jgi:hypothetical protein
MQDLIDRISSRTGLDAAKSECVLGIVLGLLRTEGDPAKVGELFARLPGAADLAARHRGDRGGLLGMLVRGGPLAAVAKLTAAGLSMDQIKTLGTVTLDYAKDKAGDELVGEVAGSIPGLGSYL